MKRKEKHDGTKENRKKETIGKTEKTNETKLKRKTGNKKKNRKINEK